MVDESSVDYGALKSLIGRWEGSKGSDVSPESDGVERNPYREHLEFEAIGEVVNAEEERLAVLTYRQRIFRIKDGKRIHDQVGYWMWNAKDQSIVHSFSIPRGVGVTAIGVVESGVNGAVLSVRADPEQNSSAICETLFMKQNARTCLFEMSITIHNENEISYRQATLLDIYGDKFEHTDECALKRV